MFITQTVFGRSDPATADSTAAGLPTTPGGDVAPSLFVSIDADGTVHLTCHQSEMGHQVWTAMAQIIADELESDWVRVQIRQAEGHPRYCDQNTDGSRSVRWNLDRLRLTGAAMHAIVERAAAERWGVVPATCRGVQNWVVHESSGRRVGYGEVAEVAAELDLPDVGDIRLKNRSEWRYINTETASLTTPLIVRGAAVYGITCGRRECFTPWWLGRRRCWAGLGGTTTALYWTFPAFSGPLNCRPCERLWASGPSAASP